MAGYDRLDVRPWQPKCPQLFPARFCPARQQRHAPLAPSQMSRADQRNSSGKDERGRSPRAGHEPMFGLGEPSQTSVPVDRGRVWEPHAEMWETDGKGKLFFRSETTRNKGVTRRRACNPSSPPTRAGQTKQMPEPVPPLCAVILDVTRWRRRTSRGLAGR